MLRINERDDPLHFRLWLEGFGTGAKLGLYPPIADALGQYPPLYATSRSSDIITYIDIAYGKSGLTSKDGIVRYHDKDPRIMNHRGADQPSGNFHTWVEMKDNEHLSALLTKWTTGPEKARRLPNDIVLHVDPYGSYRYVKYVGEEPVAAIQVMSKGGVAHVTNAFTARDHRRKGYGRELIQTAYEQFPNLTFSADRSDSGDEFVKGVKREVS